MSWKSCNTLTGSAAEGGQYYKRINVQNELWRKIERGDHIRFRAPRRTGKTSILKYIAKNPSKGYKCIYKNIESDKSSDDFYIRLIELTIVLIKGQKKVWLALQDWRDTVKIKEIGSKIKIEREKIDYKSKFLTLVEDLDTSYRRDKMVLFLDEFPDMLLKVSENEGKESASDILDTLRALRHNDNFNRNFLMVLTGSVSLLHVVRQISELKVINDLAEITLDEMSRNETEKFVEFLTLDASMQLDDNIRDYLISKVNQNIPYYIQLMIDGCDIRLQELEKTNLTEEDVNIVWNNISKRNISFENWESRLDRYFKGENNFLKEILYKCAHNGSISVQEVFDISTKEDYGYGKKWKSMIENILISDGYLNENNKKYEFVSPILKEWWINRFPKLN